jgi:RNA polymerase sigma-70 factor (ECF subfamily)
MLDVAALPSAETAEERLEFDAIYREHFAFVWRSARRLGVREASLDDVVQEVFVVVHRRLSSFEGRSSLKTWLFGVTLRVVRDHRRSARRREDVADVDPDALRAEEGGPSEQAEKAEAVRALVAGALGINLNTAYARLRAARQSFEQSVARHRARDGWRLR